MLKFWRKILISIILIAVVLFALFIFFAKTPHKKVMSSKELLQEIGLSSPKLQGFTVEKYFYDEEEKAAKAVLKSPQATIRIEAINDIDKTSAGILLDDKILTIHALYGAALSPYPGEISNKIICKEKFKPHFNTKQTEFNYSYFTLFATDRFTYGACSEDLIKYKAVLAWAYCGEKNIFYQFELFSPVETFLEPYQDLATSFIC